MHTPPSTPEPGSAALDRRAVLAGALATTAVVALRNPSLSAASSLASGRAVHPSDPNPEVMAHELPPLPYADNALAPTISANTIGFHYGKHHKAYVDNLNALLKDLPDLAALSLEDVIKKSHGDAAKAGVFNNAAQVWNHTFYWKSMSPKGGGQPTGKLLDLIGTSFGGYDKFKEAFSTAGKTQFGSGWAWLVYEGGKLTVEKTPNADTPMARGKKCLLTMDVWEHAYYLDFQNRRPDYITAFLDKLVNWEFAAANLG
jgi:Fe-Mn family superoxide dismutase